MKTFIKRSDGRWEARYIKKRSSEGQAIYGYLYARSYREVKVKLQNQIIMSEQAAPVAHINRVVFQLVAEEWFSVHTPQIKVSTANKYRNLLETYIYPQIGTTELSQITHSFLEEPCNFLLQSGRKDGSGLSPKTVSDILSVIRNVLKFASRSGKYIPCDGKNIRIKHPTTEMRVLSTWI